MRILQYTRQFFIGARQAKKLVHELRRSFGAIPEVNGDHFMSFVGQNALDLTMPASWYPLARSMERTVIAHLGPPNSGKTHQAIEALISSDKGVYCGPLRLLAWEVAERINARGVACDLITGQERKQIPGANHAACTVEMASTNGHFDVAIIDEIQLLSDPSRGWAFTRALMGLPANEIHVCGDPCSLPLLQRLCDHTKEQLIVKTYERLSPLEVSLKSINCLSKVRTGDAVVAFSRKDVHAMRQKVELLAGRHCAVVYGSLPPHTRSNQALLFNAPQSGVGVIAASDAIGMGLNLHLGRVIFSTMRKYDGIEERLLRPAEVKQIAGRAGRFNSRYGKGGVVTTLHKEDLPLLRDALETPSEPLKAAALFPAFGQLRTVASASDTSDLDLCAVLDRFETEAAVDDEAFFLCDFKGVKANAELLKDLDLSLYEQYLFSISPCDPVDELLATAFHDFASYFASRQGPVTPKLISHPELKLARNAAELKNLEAIHRTYDLFIWLSYRFEDSFEGREEAIQMQNLCAYLVDKSIRNLGAVKTKPTREKKKPKRKISEC